MPVTPEEYEYLKNYVHEYLDRNGKLTPDKIIDKVCNYFGKKRVEVLYKSRLRELVIVRQVIAYFMKKLIEIDKRPISQEGIGEVLGLNHATVLHSIRTVNNLMDSDKEFKANIETLEKLLIPDKKDLSLSKEKENIQKFPAIELRKLENPE